MAPLSECYYMSAHGVDSLVDTSRAERELGWQPIRNNVQALREAYDWYVESLTTRGTAQTKHPVPLTHRIHKKLTGFIR